MSNTIHGKANFAFLSQPDRGFGKEEYSVTLELPKEKAQEHIKIIQGVISKEVAEAHKKAPNQTSPLKRAPLPYKENGDVVTFKIHSKFKPKLWDKDQKELAPDISIWKNSVLWANYKLQGYNKSIGIGCTLYLGDVQIDTLVQGNNSSDGSCPFPNRAEIKSKLQEEIILGLSDDVIDLSKKEVEATV
jgi:hypothetical protein|tara:strand:+ start:614 stop:1180 length:567 start_codon:yes stop_codon:yes gene_type:complete